MGTVGFMFRAEFLSHCTKTYILADAKKTKLLVDRESDTEKTSENLDDRFTILTDAP